MFRYVFWPDGIAQALNSEVFRCHFHLQVVTTLEDFFLVEESLHELQARGILLEVVILAPQKDGTIYTTNTLLRLVSGGARVFWHIQSSLSLETERFFIIDKQALWSTFELKELDEVGVVYPILQKNKLFEEYCRSSEKVINNSGKIEINFQSSRDYVPVGELVDLAWDVQNAEIVVLEPGYGEVDHKDKCERMVLQDTLFRITARNKTTQETKSLFIKSIPNQAIVFEVFAYESDMDTFIPVSSPKGFDGYYAAYAGQQIRLTWNAGTVGKLRETTVGDLPLQGERLLTIDQDMSLFYELKTLFGTNRFELKFFVVAEIEEPVSLDAYELEEAMAVLKQMSAGNSNSSFQSIWAFILLFFARQKKQQKS